MVSSSGGHFDQLFEIKRNLNKEYNYHWVIPNFIDRTDDNSTKFYSAYYPTNRNIINFLKNLKLAVFLFIRLKPILLLSTGAGIAVPFFLLSKLFRINSIYIESISRINTVSFSGKIIYRFATDFIVQWESLKKFYPKSKYLGKVL